MKQIFAFETKEEYEEHEGLIKRLNEKLKVYQAELEANYKLIDKPKAIVWTSVELATTVFSNLPLPAFTNRDTIYISPELFKWRELFLKQLEGKNHAKVEAFYKNMSENQLLTIVGHELTHHSDLFVDEFDADREDSIWFEEGMCDYLSRKRILNDQEFKDVTAVERELVDMFHGKYGNHSLDDFGEASYQGSLSSILFNYWRSFLVVTYLVEERANNNIHQVFSEYHKWHENGRKQPLTKYFEVESFFSGSV
ncbi:hypothetical protein [Radiobacillus deserti]|uniref:Uncharacterized protein n=1 Tax=Radiobacillus deserti TaxID=2594883 RepID=A0A516KJB2_9BACI|nr:hypothetical protein [Radiobacillus deserti]QDP41487.1 hypothetical protein FN924_15680 [Radiobacillus deserti]